MSAANDQCLLTAELLLVRLSMAAEHIFFDGSKSNSGHNADADLSETGA